MNLVDNGKLDITAALPIRRSNVATPAARASILIPLTLFSTLAELGDLSATRFIPLCYQSSIGGDATHAFIEITRFDEQWQHWLRVHQEAIRFSEITPEGAKLRLFIEAGFQVAFSIDNALAQLTGDALLLCGSGPHLLISSLPESRLVNSLLKPAITVSSAAMREDNIPAPAPLISLQLRPREIFQEQQQYAALILATVAEQQALVRWVLRAPSPMLATLSSHQDDRRIIIFNHDVGGFLPPLACGQLMIEAYQQQQSRILLPHHLELAPKLPVSTLIELLKLKPHQRILIFNEQLETYQLTIDDDQLQPLRRAPLREWQRRQSQTR